MQQRYWVFRDYLDADGSNLIWKWLHEDVPVVARPAINAQIHRMQFLKDLRPPHARLLERECAGLLEVRVTLKERTEEVQYRPIGYCRPQVGEVILLCGAIERGSQLVPAGVCRTAFHRRDLVEFGERRTVEHDES